MASSIRIVIRGGELECSRCSELCLGDVCDCLRGSTEALESFGVGAEGFAASAVVIEPRHANAFRLVNAHPPSGKAVACRHDMLVKIFEGDEALARGARSLLGGDSNLDPFTGNDASEDAYTDHRAMLCELSI